MEPEMSRIEATFCLVAKSLGWSVIGLCVVAEIGLLGFCAWERFT